MLQKVKTALRANGTAFDSEIEDLIEAAKCDLMGAGVSVDDTDPLHVQAIICFCKARYGYEDPNQADRYWAAYEQHKIHLAIVAGVKGGHTEKPKREPLTGVDLSKLDDDGSFVLSHGEKDAIYTLKKTDTGYELERPDGKGSVTITTADVTGSIPGGDSP